jgi:hypothetical protein
MIKVEGRIVHQIGRLVNHFSREGVMTTLMQLSSLFLNRLWRIIRGVEGMMALESETRSPSLEYLLGCVLFLRRNQSCGRSEEIVRPDAATARSIAGRVEISG